MTEVVDPREPTFTPEVPLPEGDAVGDREGLAEKPRSFGQLAWRRFRRHKLALAGAIGLVLIGLLFIIAPILSEFSVTQRTGERMASPSASHPLGTDEIQRDLWTRTTVGGRYSMAIGLQVAVMATVIGTTLGMLAGYFGKWVDTLISQIVNLVLIVPALIVLAVFAHRWGAGPVGVSVILALLLWTRIARVVRGVVLGLKEQEFVMAARAAGARPPRILFRHILPNIVGPVVVELTLLIGFAIVLESTLSFLGLGVQAPIPTLGNLVGEARTQLESQPRRVLTPGILIVLIVLCVNFLGDGLRDALDPRSKQERS